MQIFHIDKNKILRNWWYWIPGIYMVLLIGALYSSFLNLLTLDLISYFSIAKHYQNLYFTEAFNSYWSPLICWLLACMPNLTSDPMSAFRWINIAAALLIYRQMYFWLRLTLKNSVPRFFAALLLATLFSYYALCVGSPDFISVFPFLLFLRLIIGRNTSVRHGCWLALSIALCFFAKTFLLLLCFAILVLVLGYNFLYRKESPAAVFLFSLLASIGIILCIWSYCLKQHYGYYTLSATMKINTAKQSHEPLSLLPPTSVHGLFAWEDPQRIETKSLYPETVTGAVQQQVLKWEYNWHITRYYFRYISFLQMGILIIPLIGLFYCKNRALRIQLLLSAVFVANWFGYFSIVMQERYLIVGQVCLYVSVLGISETILVRCFVNLKQRAFFINVFIFVLFLSMLKNPLQEGLREYNNYAFQVEDITEANAIAASGVLAGKSIATYLDDQLFCNRIALACFLSDGKYFGELDPDSSVEEQQAQIKKFGLDLVTNPYCESLRCVNKIWLNDKPAQYKSVGYSIVDVK